jgi:uncharacterized protein (DUF983 family)
MTSSKLDSPAHNVWSAIGHGLRGRCPNCGQGRLYHNFIEPVETCPTCAEPLGRYNVGLLLPFVVIMIVAHVLIGVMLSMEVGGKNNAGTYLSVMVPLSVIIPLAVLRSVKGALIAILWARGLSDELDR